MKANAAAKAILALAGGAILATTSLGSVALAQADAAGDLNKCLDRQIARLAPSGDGSDTIGRAALYRCRDELLNLQRERGALGGADMERLALDASVTRAVEFKAAQSMKARGQAKGPNPH